MVTIKDGCGCGPCDCDWKEKLKLAYSRAIQSVNKVGDNDGSIYYPDGTGFVKLPLPRQSEISLIHTNAEDIANLKIQDIQLQANITAEETARKAKDELLDADITRIDNTDTEQDQKIQDNADRLTSTYNDLVSTEATVATHDSEIITLQAQTQALSKSLVSDVIMTDGTTAGSVQVSIEREDGALITSANYRWGRDIGIRLEAGTQEGFVKAVISLSDGTELVSNEYKIVEVLESDVYVTAITLIADQAAGTLGGNISYSNGTTQTINSVSVPTAPGVTSAIETLQSRMSAVEQKNTTQDSQISALDARVQAIEDTPGIGQFAAGKLGTIAGSSADGRVKAEDDGTGSVNGWSDLKGRVSTTEGQIVTAQNDITDLNGMVAGKIDIMQGAANAGKALVVGSDGNVSPGTISSGEIWDEVDLTNFPTDWKVGDRIRISFKICRSSTTGLLDTATFTNPVMDLYILSLNQAYINYPFIKNTDCYAYLNYIGYDNFNSSITDNTLFYFVINYGSIKGLSVTKSNISNYVYKLWRLKQ